MKLKSFTILFLLLSQFAYTQTPIPGTYETNNDIDKFVGIWKWSNTTDAVFIEFKKVKYFWPVSKYFQDVLMGCHSYTKNGIIIESSMNDISLIQPQMNVKKGSLLGYNLLYEGPSKIYCFFSDITKSKQGKINIEYIYNATPQIYWELEPLFDIILDPTAEGLTLPQNIVLTKQ